MSLLTDRHPQRTKSRCSSAADVSTLSSHAHGIGTWGSEGRESHARAARPHTGTRSAGLGTRSAGLGRARLDWDALGWTGTRSAGLGRARLDWDALGWTGTRSAELGRARLDWDALGWTRDALGWTGTRSAGLGRARRAHFVRCRLVRGSVSNRSGSTTTHPSAIRNGYSNGSQAAT